MGKKSGNETESVERQSNGVDNRRETVAPGSEEERISRRNARLRERRAARKTAASASASSIETAAGISGEEQTPPLTPVDFQTETIISPEAQAQPDQPKRRYRRNPKREAEQQAEVTTQAVILMALLDGVVGSAFGEDARRNEIERQFTDEALGRMFTRLNPAIVDAIQQYTDPVMFVVGLSMWGARVYRIEADKPKPAQPIPGIPVAEYEQPPTPPNGRVYVGPPPTTPPIDVLELDGNSDGVTI